MSDDSREKTIATSRRRMLLVGTALATIGTLGTVQQAQAQQTPAPAASPTSWRSSRSSSPTSSSNPCQTGSSLNAAGINYGLLRQQEALKQLKVLEGMRPR
ncbi:MAG: hypothetical protein ACOY4R_10190 [Pseudomonadota bacterium]